MNTKLQMFILQNRKLFIILGITMTIGGVALAYFTGDAEPWGTMGGIFSALGVILILLIVGLSKKG